MGLTAFNQVGGHLGLIFIHDTNAELIYAIFAIVNGLLAGIACIGLWKVKTWVMRAMTWWAITIIPTVIAMKYVLEQYQILSKFPPLLIFLALILNIVIVALLLTYVNRVTTDHPNKSLKSGTPKSGAP
jgi:uncharacterized membrane protein (DUF2068 family)